MGFLLDTLLRKEDIPQILIPESFEREVGEKWKGRSFRLSGRDPILEESIAKTVSYLFRHQAKEGYWVGELEANVSITCEWMMLLYFLGILDEERKRKAANYLLETQLENGAWDIYYGFGGDLSTTVEAYFCLKMAGYSPEEPFMKKARQFILENGGMLKCRMMTRIWLALFDQFDWRGIPSMPVQFMLMPRFQPFNIYNLASWARAIIVPLLIIFDFKPKKEIPPSMRLDELYPVPKEELEYSFGKAERFFSWRNFFLKLDKLLKLMENNVLKWFFHKKALKLAEKWTLEHQIETGDCAGIFPAMANTVLALHLLGYPLDSEPVKKGLEAIDRFILEEENTLRVQSCVSPVWDTAWTVYALGTSGYTFRHPQVKKALDWLFSKQVHVKGDWAVKNPHIEPGGWAFQFDNYLNPDVDDTAVVLMALLSDNLKQEEKKKEFLRAFRWMLSMQNPDGGFGAFERENDYYIFNEFPFSESDNLIDPSTEDVTGRVLEAAGQMGLDKSHPQIRWAIEYLKGKQDPRGSWYGRWGVNHIYGTWSVLCGLRSVGEDMKAPYVQKAVAWLKSIQNPDGGFGESCRSYVDPSWIGRGESTASQTAWAVMALIAAGEEKSEAVRRGIDYLIRTQKEDGTWEEPYFTGTGFPQFFLIRYHMYRIYFPLLALARYWHTLGEREG